ncbi:MAG: hypothetical protein GX042_05355 [Bacteroidales bacterium]|jgi:hypothetical protein|nr:hypothetical protein [Bacteroidales bacterium]
MKQIISKIYDSILSEEAKIRLERTVFILAMAGFLIHLVVIALIHIGWIDAGSSIKGLQNPVDAIYTPFSILLFYEVYCLIYYLPKSITIYIGKQFEIITLITIREIFAELSSLTLSSDLQQMYSDLQFIYSMVTILVLFFLIYLFYRLNQKAIRINNNTHGQMSRMPEKKKKYAYAKKILTLIVGLIFIVLAIINLSEWLMSNHSLFDFLQNTKPATKEFFSSFFMVLILNDVLVLLFSFAITESFPKVIRNSGFVISTTLIKLSFSVSGLASHLLVIMSVLFGTFILILYKRYKTIEVPTE